MPPSQRENIARSASLLARLWAWSAPALLIGLATAGCHKDSGPQWQVLAQGFHPTPWNETLEFPAGIRMALGEDDPSRIRITARIAPEVWRPDRIEGQWVCDVPLGGKLERFEAGRIELEGDRLAFRQVETPRRDEVDAFERGVFYLTPGRVHLRPEGGERPPPLDYGVDLDRGEEREGRWRTWVGGISGEGLPVWPGTREEVTCTLPPNSQLTFATAYQSLLPSSQGSARFRVRVDGEQVFEHTLDPAGGPAGASSPFRLDLTPWAGRRTLTFEVDGDPGMAAFFNLTLGPAQRGTYAERPWGPGRPDLVIFLIDTFRADNLEAYGGRGLTPALDDMVSRGVAFRRAWSQAGWTLPAQVSLLSGVMPREHGAVDKALAFPQGLVSLAECLAEAGYRCGAVTDSGFISRNYGFDQGFEWFEETHLDDWDLGQTFRSALDFYDRDDGRPTFLFVQTYRVHAPYRQGVDEDVSRWRELVREAALDLKQRGATVEDVAPATVEAFRSLYEDGVRSLDEEFGPWLEAIESRGVLERGTLVLTSDHGEAFWEHGDFLHGGVLWEEKTRIPLVLYGGGLQPRVVRHGVSLVDIAPTLTRLAGVPAPPGWWGTDLLSLNDDRPIFVFGDEIERLGHRVTVIDGARKVYLQNEPEGDVLRAFDLERDPGETNDLRDTSEWPGQMKQRVREALESFNVPRTDAEAADLTPDKQRALEAMGYGGGGQ